MTNVKILQFPRPPIAEKLAPAVVAPDLTVAPMTRCDGLIHVFPRDLPARCQCGSELWVEVEEP